MDKKVKEDIMRVMDVESNLEQDFVVNLIRMHAPNLDVEALKERKYKEMANNL